MSCGKVIATFQISLAYHKRWLKTYSERALSTPPISPWSLAQTLMIACPGTQRARVRVTDAQRNAPAQCRGRPYFRFLPPSLRP
jgi:hypothetical protein